jgi:hypothetical protein
LRPVEELVQAASATKMRSSIRLTPFVERCVIATTKAIAQAPRGMVCVFVGELSTLLLVPRIMTQILAVLTQEYVLVAADRQLTFVGGPRKGEVADDDTCKLVSLCGIWGIAYTGFSQLQGVPTHEWIATRLAEKGCRDGLSAARILAHAAESALKMAPFALELTFLITGWARLADGQTLRPHFLVVSNKYQPDGTLRATLGSDFAAFERVLKPDDLLAGHVIGQDLRDGRAKYLVRILRRMLEHGAGPKPAMRALVSEIHHTVRPGGTVGEKILAFAIPKAAAERTYRTGHAVMLASEPDLINAAFCYFDPAYSQLHQYGPTSVCGAAAVTDLETQSHPTGYGRSGFRILHLPKQGKQA